MSTRGLGFDGPDVKVDERNVNEDNRSLEEMFYKAKEIIGGQENERMQIAEASNVNQNKRQFTDLDELTRKFSELGKPLSKVYEILKEKELLTLLNATPKNPHNLKKSKYCDYHGHHGHDTDRCTRLMHDIQDVIDNGMIPDPKKGDSRHDA